MLVSCYVAPNPSSSTKCQSIKIGSDLWQLIKTSVWQEKCFIFSQAHFTSHNMSIFWSPIYYAYEIFLTSDAKSETNWNQINQITRLTYFCLTLHEESLYRTPNYLMENQKQSKKIQYCSNLLYTFHGKKVLMMEIYIFVPYYSSSTIVLRRASIWRKSWCLTVWGVHWQLKQFRVFFLLD